MNRNKIQNLKVPNSFSAFKNSDFAPSEFAYVFAAMALNSGHIAYVSYASCQICRIFSLFPSAGNLYASAVHCEWFSHVYREKM